MYRKIFSAVNSPSTPTPETISPIIKIISEITASKSNGDSSGNFQASTSQRRLILAMSIAPLHYFAVNLKHVHVAASILQVAKFSEPLPKAMKEACAMILFYVVNKILPINCWRLDNSIATHDDVR